MVEYPQQDVVFLQWTEQNPTGFVINAHKTSAVPMYWHRADCGHLKPDAPDQCEKM